MAKKNKKKVMEEKEIKGQEKVVEEAPASEGTSNEKKESSGGEKKEETDESKKIVKEVNVDFKDKYIRLSAEFDNYRKRTAKEKVDLIKNASGEILKNMLPIIDDFERALSSMSDAKDIDAVKNGTKLIYNKFNDFLKTNGLKEIEAMHQDFNTDLHEALTKIPAPEEKLKGKIVDVIQKGYILNDSIIRFSKVVIGE